MREHDIMGESVSQELVDRIAEAVIRKLDEREKISAIAREVVLMLAERQPQARTHPQPAPAAMGAAEPARSRARDATGE